MIIKVISHTGSSQIMKTIFIHNSLQLTMKPLYIILSRVLLDCLSFSLYSCKVKRRLAMYMGVQNLFLGPPPPSISLMYTACYLPI